MLVSGRITQQERFLQKTQLCMKQTNKIGIITVFPRFLQDTWRCSPRNHRIRKWRRASACQSVKNNSFEKMRPLEGPSLDGKSQQKLMQYIEMCIYINIYIYVCVCDLWNYPMICLQSVFSWHDWSFISIPVCTTLLVNHPMPTRCQSLPPVIAWNSERIELPMDPEILPSRQVGIQNHMKLMKCLTQTVKLLKYAKPSIMFFTSWGCHKWRKQRQFILSPYQRGYAMLQKRFCPQQVT